VAAIVRIGPGITDYEVMLRGNSVREGNQASALGSRQLPRGTVDNIRKFGGHTKHVPVHDNPGRCQRDPLQGKRDDSFQHDNV